MAENVDIHPILILILGIVIVLLIILGGIVDLPETANNGSVIL